MKAYYRVVFCAAIFMLAGLGMSDLQAQENAVMPPVLHMQQSTTTAAPNFPPFLTMYHVLDGAKSPAEALSLTGTISLKNFGPTFSEELFVLAYWQGECPANDINLTEVTEIIWIDIVKNPSLGDSTLPINLEFPHPLPMSGCIGLYYNGGALVKG